jgi:hypothetical protein
MSIAGLLAQLEGIWSSYGEYIVVISTILIVLIAFGLLLAEKEEKWRFYISIILILIGSFVTFAVSPLSKEWSTLLSGLFFTPLAAYIFEYLKDKQRISKEKDKISYDYKCQQIEKESNIIGELLGELSTHAAAFKSYGTQEIETERWNKSFRAGLVSDIHTFSVARYYYFVTMYNQIVKDLNQLEQEGEGEMKDSLESFSEMKKAFFETETAIFHTLLFDLGVLQQKLSRPTVEFPPHMNLLLRKRLEKFGIIKKGEDIDAALIFAKKNLERFNLKMGAHLNACYANMALTIKDAKKKVAEIKSRSVSNKN